MGEFSHRSYTPTNFMGEFSHKSLRGKTRKKEVITISIFLSNKDKRRTVVGFSKKDIKLHTGIYGLKYYLIVMYFRKHLDTFGEVTFSLNKLLGECGYSIKSHNNSSHEDFRRIIQEEIIDKGYGFSEDNILQVKPTSIFSIQLSRKKQLFFTDDNFVPVSIEEFETIAAYSLSSVNKSALIGVYLFIKQFIMDDSISSKSAPNISYPSKRQMQKGLGLSITTIERAIDVLSELKLIYVRRDLYIKDASKSGYYVPARNVYALTKKDANSDNVLSELEKIYGQPVYDRDSIKGSVGFLSKM